MRAFLLLICLSAACLSAWAQLPFTAGDRAFMGRTSRLLDSTLTLTNGLQGYWRLEESSGTRYDMSKNGNHLTANNSPSQAAGKVGSCATFSAASVQSLSVASTTALQSAGGSLSVSLWFKPTAFSATGNWLVNKRGAAINGGFQICIFNSDKKLQQVLQNSDASAAVSVTNAVVSTGNWYHTCMVWDNSTKVLTSYLNGISLTATNLSYSIPSGTAQLMIGSNAWAPDANLSHSGSIDEVGIWNRALTPSEVGQLYASSNGVTFPRFQR